MPVTDASVTAELLDNVTMACEIYGYFPPELPEIVWRFVAAGEDSIDLSDQATLLEGSRFIQNGESPIPSVISELTIFNISNSDEGTYTCHSFQEVEVFTLTIISGQKTQLLTCIDDLCPLSLSEGTAPAVVLMTFTHYL